MKTARPLTVALLVFTSWQLAPLDATGSQQGRGHKNVRIIDGGRSLPIGEPVATSSGFEVLVFSHEAALEAREIWLLGITIEIGDSLWELSTKPHAMLLEPRLVKGEPHQLRLVPETLVPPGFYGLTGSLDSLSMEPSIAVGLDPLVAQLLAEAEQADATESTALSLALGELAVRLGADTGEHSVLRLFAQLQQEKRTMGDVRTLATAVESFSIDHGVYPESESLVNAVELAHLLSPTYVRTTPTDDAWGRPVLYRSLDSAEGYQIASAGADGRFEDLSIEFSSEGPDGPGDDIVFATGSFTSWPHAHQLDQEERQAEKLVEAVMMGEQGRRAFTRDVLTNFVAALDYERASSKKRPPRAPKSVACSSVPELVGLFGSNKPPMDIYGRDIAYRSTDWGYELTALTPAGTRRPATQWPTMQEGHAVILTCRCKGPEDTGACALHSSVAISDSVPPW